MVSVYLQALMFGRETIRSSNAVRINREDGGVAVVGLAEDVVLL